MKNNFQRVKREEEIRMKAQLMVLFTYTAFTMILIGVAVSLKWEMWATMLFGLSVICAWVMHILQFQTEQQRASFYACLIILEFFFYAIHETSFYDMPVVICSIMIILSILDQIWMIFLSVATYGLVIVYYLLFTDIFYDMSTVLEYSRFALQIMTLFLSATLSRYMIRRRQEEKESYAKIIEQLHEMNEQTENFLVNVSHELRTPINAVTGISDIILQRDLDEQMHNDVQAIQNAGIRLFNQINDVLDYSELSSKRLKVGEESFYILSTLNDLVETGKRLNEEKGLELIFDIDSSVPASFIGDEAKFRRIMHNLFENAIKFTDKGGIMIRMNARQEKYGANLSVSIEDTGIGMEEGQVKQIYHNFYQIDGGRSRRAGGMGLGLSIVYGLISKMGGFLNISSQIGVGTKVDFCIPMKVNTKEKCISIDHADKIFSLVYLRKDKYSMVRIREFYDEMIGHISSMFKIRMHRVSNSRDMEHYLEHHNITHLYITNVEYQEQPEFYEELAKQIHVVMIVDAKWTPVKESNIYLIYKPFFTLSIVNSFHMQNLTNHIIYFEKFTLQDVKALVVDDDVMNLNVAGGILKNYGMEVETALGGVEALEKCERTDYDIIFMDHMMPDMDGVETMHKIRQLVSKRNENTPVVALTANAISGAREMFLGEGFQEFVAKPIERTLLERALRKVLPKSKFLYESEQKMAAEQADNDSEDLVHDIIQGDGSVMEKLERAGIDTVAGVTFCAGSEDFYIEMLEDFCKQSVQRRGEVTGFYAESDWENYTIKVHALKGNARTIGANYLADLAFELQQAGEKKEEEVIHAKHDGMIDEYDKVLSLLRGVLALETEGEGAAND